ncbi:hypothetical protein Moror_2236, partial [Moniliophthora roreri MCA 2997]
MGKRKANDPEAESSFKKAKLEPNRLSSLSPQKGNAKRKASDVVEPEKRLARYRSKCPNAISDRLDRALGQRLFLLNRQREEGELKEVFTITGSTGNVYTVTINKTPRCDCPDCGKGNHCKHIIFVFLRVLQVNRSSNHWFQKALLSYELEDIFASAPPPPQLRSVAASETAIGAWKGATGQAESSSSKATANADDKRRLPTLEDDCGICYTTLHSANMIDVKEYEGTLEWCKTCYNAVHRECWDANLLYKGGLADSKLECVYCRSPWSDPSHMPAHAGGSRTSEGYMNLAGMPGFESVSPVRDTST